VCLTHPTGFPEHRPKVVHRSSGRASSLNPNRLLAVLRDNAERTTVPVDAAKMPDEMSDGGRGLALAKSVLDILQYDAAEGNCWTLVRLLG